MFSPEQMQGIATMLIEAAGREQQTTAKVLASVPEDKLLFTLGEKGRSAHDLMWHIVASELWFLEGIVNGEFAASEGASAAPTTAKEIVEAYQSRFPAALERVKELSPEQQSKPVNFYNLFNLPAILYLNFMLNHAIHHRGQLSSYLRAMDAHVPAIYGGSADEPM